MHVFVSALDSAALECAVHEGDTVLAFLERACAALGVDAASVTACVGDAALHPADLVAATPLEEGAAVQLSLPEDVAAQWELRVRHRIDGDYDEQLLSLLANNSNCQGGEAGPVPMRRLRLLLAAGADAGYSCKRGSPLLYYAARCGDTAALQVLLAAGGADTRRVWLTASGYLYTADAERAKEGLEYLCRLDEEEPAVPCGCWVENQFICRCNKVFCAGCTWVHLLVVNALTVKNEAVHGFVRERALETAIRTLPRGEEHTALPPCAQWGQAPQWAWEDTLVPLVLFGNIELLQVMLAAAPERGVSLDVCGSTGVQRGGRCGLAPVRAAALLRRPAMLVALLEAAGSDAARLASLAAASSGEAGQAGACEECKGLALALESARRRDVSPLEGEEEATSAERVRAVLQGYTEGAPRGDGTVRQAKRRCVR